jgi:DNA-binding GntR family transcriptional regulator
LNKITEYQKLYQILRRQIIDGNYKAGDLLASENELKAIYHLSQPTVRKAVELLEKEGFVKKYHGKGSIVQPRPIGAGIISLKGDLFTTQNDSPNIFTRIMKGPFLVNRFPDNFGFSPELNERKNGFWYLERRRCVEDRIIFYEALCFPNDRLPRFKQLKLDNRPFYETICRKFEIITTGFEQRFWAISADETIAEQLNTKAGHPVQRLQRKFSTNRPEFQIFSNLSAITDSVYLFNNSR